MYRRRCASRTRWTLTPTAGRRVRTRLASGRNSAFARPEVTFFSFRNARAILSGFFHAVLLDKRVRNNSKKIKKHTLEKLTRTITK